MKGGKDDPYFERLVRDEVIYPFSSLVWRDTFINLEGLRYYLMLENSNILITGGTGSFGKFIPLTLESINQENGSCCQGMRQQEMANYSNDERVRFLGDVRDRQRLTEL